MAYNDFIKHIGIAFQNKFHEMQAIYNFDNGDEFEIALCQVLRFLLPNKYGICRGHIITFDDKHVGDDIIIYDQDKFPTLRLIDHNSFHQKQYVPVEAVYAYIEAKHTLVLEGGESISNSLAKAWKQSIAPKNLRRNEVRFGFGDNIEINEKGSSVNFQFQRAIGWPQYYNPMYTAIISCGLSLKQNQKTIRINSNKDLLMIFDKIEEYTLSHENSPDLLIVDNDCGFLPAISIPNEKLPVLESPYYIKGKSLLVPYKQEGLGFGIGMASMLYALENIKLGSIAWKSIIGQELKLDIK
jgi:hypothetical protein